MKFEQNLVRKLGKEAMEWLLDCLCFAMPPCHSISCHEKNEVSPAFFLLRPEFRNLDTRNTQEIVCMGVPANPSVH